MRSKLSVVAASCKKTIADLSLTYTPGVARVARAIARDPSLAWDLTTLGQSVGIFTNGSRVLGLGNIALGVALWFLGHVLYAAKHGYWRSSTARGVARRLRLVPAVPQAR